MSRIHRDFNPTPMEYEYDNKKGPVDNQSPFISNSFRSQDYLAKKRTHSALESPSKIGFTTPNQFQLREPNSQTYLFSPGDRPLPSVPNRLWEPRTPVSVVDSSGGETPNTPTVNDDSEAGTPDTQMANKFGKSLSFDGSKSPKKNKRQSFFGRLLGSSPSPSKEDLRKYQSKKAENKVMKRRSKTRKMALRNPEDSDDEDRDRNAASLQQNQIQPGIAANMGTFFTYLEAHPNLPSVLSYYLQLFINCCIAMFFLYMLYAAWSGVMSDVEIESKKNMAEVMVEIAACAKQYRDNGCDPRTRVPAMETLCGNWESCMQRDAHKVARASVTARTFAMIFNAFVEEFSYKSMLFTAIIIFGGFNLSNWAFGFLRSKASHHNLQHHDSFNYPPPPATPQRYPSGGLIDQGFYNQTPYQTPYGSVNANMLQQASQSMPALPAPEGSMREKRERSPRKASVFS